MSSDDIEMLRLIAIANAETANLLVRLAGMQAENIERAQRGDSLTYSASAFEAERNINYITQLLRR